MMPPPATTTLEITRHTAERRVGRLHESLLNLARDLKNSRHLSWAMMKRDLKSQYRTSFSGVFISLLPALTTAAWAVLFRDAHLINVGNINLPYPFFVLCGMMLWAVFLESLDAPISGVLSEQALLSKAKVPAEAITIARLGQVTFNFGVKALIILIAGLLYRVPVHWTIVFVPIGVLLIMALGSSIGLILAPINLLYTDVAKALPIVTTFWFFTTPIIFTTPARGWAEVVMHRLNPVTALLTATRELPFGAFHGVTTALEVSVLFTLCLFCFAMFFHRLSMPIVIDRANA